MELVVLDAFSGLKSSETHLSLRHIYISKVDWDVEHIIFVNATTSVNNAIPVNVCLFFHLDFNGPRVAVSVVITQDSGPPPSVKSAVFTATGGGALITFSCDTNKVRD